MTDKDKSLAGAIDCNTVFGFLPERGLGLPADRLVELMARAGVEKALTVAAMGIYLNSEQGNAETLAVCRDHPQLLPAATVDPTALVKAAVNAGEYKSQGFAALHLFPRLQGWRVDLVTFSQIAESAQEAQLALIVALDQPGDATGLVRSLSPGSAPVVVGCRGSSLLGEVLAVAEELPNLYIETSGLLGLDAISLAAERIGADRLLFGSNAPLYCPISQMENVLASRLSEEDREKVVKTNAARILGISIGEAS
jgi:predicted TIM-barrel fold metal-dependent hydrolase